jgi:hypothetical protein
MLKSLQRTAVAAFALLSVGLTATLPAAAASKEGVFVGHVVHVSTQNIKVEDDNNQSLSFLLVPHFNKLFSTDGKTTTQMSRVHEGMWVRVFYDQHFLGTRHADKIILINHHHAKIGG